MTFFCSSPDYGGKWSSEVVKTLFFAFYLILVEKLSRGRFRSTFSWKGRLCKKVEDPRSSLNINTATQP